MPSSRPPKGPGKTRLEPFFSSWNETLRMASQRCQGWGGEGSALKSAQMLAPGQCWTFTGAAHTVTHRAGARVLRAGGHRVPLGGSLLSSSPPPPPPPAIRGLSFRSLGI